MSATALVQSPNRSNALHPTQSQINTRSGFKTSFQGIFWHKGLLPVLVQNYFQYARSIHGYNTRYASKQNLYKPKERTNTGKQTVAFSASVLWVDIPVSLKNLNAFKFAKKLKHYLLSEQHSETLS